MKVMIHGKERDIFMTTLQVFYTEWRKSMLIRYAVMGHTQDGFFDEIMSFPTVEKAIALQKELEQQLALEYEEASQHLPSPEVCDG